MEEKKLPKGPLILSKSGLPPAPEGVSELEWKERQAALQYKAGMPKDQVARIDTLRQMNLYLFLCVAGGAPWKEVRDNEESLLRGNAQS